MFIRLIAAMVFLQGPQQTKDTIAIHRDPRLEVFTKKQIAINKTTSRMTSNGQYRGYRLQLLSTRSRNDAYQLKASLLQQFPEEKAYVLFQSPNFKVRLGNFMEKKDAMGFKKQMGKFSQNAYVVEDAVEFTMPENQP